MIANRSALAHVFLAANGKAVFSVGLALFVLALSLGALAQQATITSFDPPGSLQTEPISINSAGAVTGFYEDATASHGFLRAPDGSFTSFDAPGGTGTTPMSINSAGSIAGYYLESQMFHGFLRDPEGNFTTFDPPGSTSTMAASLNSAGTIAGYYTVADHSFHGFVRYPDGTITSFVPAGATFTRATSINSAGVITGFYQDSAQLYHGFVRATNGAITTFLAESGENCLPASINSTGEITGQSGPLNDPRGFLRAADGTITLFTPVAPSAGVVPTGLNDAGMIGGFYVALSAGGHGFIRRPNGTFTTFGLPDVQFIIPLSINAGGAVTGYYQASVYTTSHGFLLSP